MDSKTNQGAIGKVSVCMATYNGSAFVREQIESILPQLGSQDELIIVDDASSDPTVALIEQIGDSRIRLVRNPQNRGVVRSFERALELATGDLIFLSDQDDIWRSDKVEIFKRLFQERPEALLLMSDATVIDAQGNTLGKWSERVPFSASLWKNIIRNRFVGCLLAIRKELLHESLPIPAKIPMHDMWIASIANLHGAAGYIDECLVSYRRHGDTVTTGKHADFLTMLRWRIHLVLNLMRRGRSRSRPHGVR